MTNNFNIDVSKGKLDNPDCLFNMKFEHAKELFGCLLCHFGTAPRSRTRTRRGARAGARTPRRRGLSSPGSSAPSPSHLERANLV